MCLHCIGTKHRKHSLSSFFCCLALSCLVVSFFNVPCYSLSCFILSCLGEAAADQASNLGDKGDEATDDVDNSKRCHSIDAVPIFEVRMLVWCLDGVDHPVDCIWLILLFHLEAS